MQAVIEGAERPATNDMRKLYVNLYSKKIDVRVKMVMNFERLRSQAAKSSGYDVTVGKDVICLIIIANTKWAASQDWGGEFRDAMRRIQAQHVSPGGYRIQRRCGGGNQQSRWYRY